MKTRLATLCATASAAALLLAACSSSTSSDSSSNADGTTAATAAASVSAAAVSDVCAATPTPGGTLTAARQNETLSLSPYVTPGGWGDGSAQALIYRGLVQLDPTGETKEVVPAISDTWTVTPDGLSYTFHIRDGAKFSNGDLITAADVKASLDRWADPDIDTFAAFSTGYKSSTVVDDQNIQIDLSEATGAFLDELAFLPAVVLPEKLVKEQGDAFYENPVGAGPYKLDTWTKGSSISFVKNDNYWEPEQPLLDGVVYNFVTDDNARLLQLQSGPAQMIDFLPFAQATSMQSTDGIAVDPAEIPSWILLSLNNQKKPLADLKVRQALSYAIDRDAINEKIYAGLGKTPNSVLPHLALDGTDADVPPVTFDLEKAKQLMAESAYPTGFDATLEFPSGSTAFQSLAAVLQAEWAELGVNLTLAPEDQATLSKNFSGGTYDIALPYATAASDLIVPDEFGTFYAIPGSTNGFFTWWEDAEIAKMMTEFIHTTDAASRAEQ
ncbi:MAG: ABC transporter substrate-binding protein, partial [bacterium]|nr:ABC transporter substrate-binding protein [bacterium]